MKYAALVVVDYYQKNNIFNFDDPILNRNDYLYHMYILKNQFAKNGYELMTYDCKDANDFDIFLFFDYIDEELLKNIPKDKQKILVMLEPEIIRPEIWLTSRHQGFDKIFTWNPKLVDNKTYFQYYLPNKIIKKINKNLSNKEKFCCIIASNKINYDPRELYSQRIKTIRWFEKKHPDKFDFYGVGWDRFYFKRPFGRLNRVPIISKRFIFKYPSYRGEIYSKQETMNKYKFAICYENSQQIPGYISEKIFDCFFAGVVPVYWGAPDITDYIPKDLFIDRRNFETHEELYSFMSSISDQEYCAYLERIEKFLNSDDVEKFSVQYFGDLITQIIK